MRKSPQFFGVSKVSLAKQLAGKQKTHKTNNHQSCGDLIYVSKSIDRWERENQKSPIRGAG
jgi:hypothetical protein